MTTLLVVCGALAREVIALRDKHQWNAAVFALPVLLHNTPQHIPDAVIDKIKLLRPDYAKVVVVYGDCGTSGVLDTRLAEIGVDRIEGPHCYEIYAGDTFQSLMEEEPGTYFLTDYLVQSFDHLVVEGLGLDRFPELHEMYFGNYRRVVYLRQREDLQLLSKAQDAAEFLRLPLDVRSLGYGGLEARLSAMLANPA